MLKIIEKYEGKFEAIGIKFECCVLQNEARILFKNNFLADFFENTNISEHVFLNSIGEIENGYLATDFTEILFERYLKKENNKILNILFHAFCLVGIIPLVDEATGYQKVRFKKANYLQEAFIIDILKNETNK